MSICFIKNPNVNKKRNFFFFFFFLRGLGGGGVEKQRVLSK